MKTPREILFERHRRAEPRLDAVRQHALAELTAAGSVEELRQGRNERLLSRRLDNSEYGILKKAWLELFWPYRRAWAGMAMVWLALVAANLGMKATATSSPAARSAHRGDLVQAVEEQRRLLAELLPATKPQPAEPPRPSPRPRSERLVPFRRC
jgi:hypothetical protein